MKKCTKCKEYQEYQEFPNHSGTKDKKGSWCKTCLLLNQRNRLHNPKNLIYRTYANQEVNSKQKQLPPPTYTREELYDWLYSGTKFKELYKSWSSSGYPKNLLPSIDRKNDYLGYTFDNIQLMTWEENKTKNYRDRIAGKNTKGLIPIKQFKSGVFIKDYYSMAQASRELKVPTHTITNAVYKGLEVNGFTLHVAR